MLFSHTRWRIKIGILGIPFNGDGTRPEMENPAAAFREAGLTKLKIRSGDTLLDYGDLLIPVFDGDRDPSTKILNLNAWKEISQHTAKRFMGVSVSCYHPNLDSNLEAASRVVDMLGSALSSGD